MKKTYLAAAVVACGLAGGLASSAQAVPTSGNQIVGYQAHVSYVGWQPPVYDGAVAGTTGQGLAMEALTASLNPYQLPGAHLCYQAHVSYIGWQAPVCDGAVAGTTGQGKPMEAVRVSLSSAPGWQVCYQAHVATIGWQPEVCDNAVAGTTGRGLQMEAVRISVRPRPVTVPALAPNPVTAQDFSGSCFTSATGTVCPRSDLAEDNIALSVVRPYGMPSWQAQITFRTAPNVTWWKEVKAVSNDGQVIGSLDLQDSQHGPLTMTIDTRSTASLVFSKAKVFGVHTPVYDMRNLAQLAGSQAVFTWNMD